MGAADWTVGLSALALYLATAAHDLRAHTPKLTDVPLMAMATSAALVASSHLCYALVWFAPNHFAQACNHNPLKRCGKHPVDVFSVLVLLTKIIQQIGLLLLVVNDRPKPLQLVYQIIAHAGPHRWVAAMLLLVLGQVLNAAIYLAIGKDGVYYGFKLGRPVPWSYDFPFNVGFRHPQYVGGVLSQLSLFCLFTTATTAACGIGYLLSWWLILYMLTSWMEASGDNIPESSKAS